MPEGPEQQESPRIETFQSCSRLELQPLWLCPWPDGSEAPALAHPWAPQARPDWTARGLIVWPRGQQWWRLRLRLSCPSAWVDLAGAAEARLVLRWWADRAELWVNGTCRHRGDLFDTACRWLLPRSWWQGEPLELELRLRSPLHDDGALMHSRLELEPTDPADPQGLLAETAAALVKLRQGRTLPLAAPVSLEPGQPGFHVLGHAHLDLAWLWPVADTWQAAERTFASALDLMQRFPQLHFGHSTPALYAWLERHRPALFERIRAAMRAGRWEPLNGPWVETDCVLVSTASLLRQFQEGQHYSQAAFPEWEHSLAWLPDSFGFGAGLPAVAAATGVRWFCTHKLAWNASTPFPHRLFRWRSRGSGEVLALMTAPIGTDGDPEAMERYRLEWQQATGHATALWLPGVGDHGGGPTAEMLEQLALWQAQPEAAPQRHGSLRQYLADLAPLAPTLPVWRDELYLELHRGCPTSRPDQKRHNRSLERLLREAELAQALLQGGKADGVQTERSQLAGAETDLPDWRDLLFQQFHDILPGSSIPEVFEQAEPQWRRARRRARRQRDQALGRWLGAAVAGEAGSVGSATGATSQDSAAAGQRDDQASDHTAEQKNDQRWWIAQLQPLAAASCTVRLPAGQWSLPGPAGDQPITSQPAASGGVWVQLPVPAGVTALPLWRRPPGRSTVGPDPAPRPVASGVEALALRDPVRLEPDPERGSDRWRLSNGLLSVAVGPAGVEQLWDASGAAQLAAPLAWRRYGDRGEFWDAWDLAADYRDHPLPWIWDGPPQWLERGPLCAAFRWRGRCGTSPLRLDGRLRAGSPWLELSLAVNWRQRHELLRLEVPLAWPAVRWATDTSGGVIERPAEPQTNRERSRWEVAAIGWLAAIGASAAGGGEPGMAVLLDGPQGVSASQQALGVSLLRGPTWPDPSADNGWQRQQLALMPCAGGWRRGGVPAEALRLREPLWGRPTATAGAPNPPPGFPALAEDLQMIALAPDPELGVVRLTVQNLGPCRRWLDVGPDWQLLERGDGLFQPLPQETGDWVQAAVLGPWEFGFWRIRRRA
ncbi:alpha-mannosidase [Synechococcus sp. CBW1006]|uniref:alpha-mannosidase n=1 Tax=Synechococcus sp. CBW1006 TaxID=1353138 RepID=UPI0018CF4FB7|nr:alpha-mannosidase [Synechococcus sp. CBW1006]QPN67206.1 alpha-mannosidase [Synechococcus sp. CBW1006]